MQAVCRVVDPVGCGVSQLLRAFSLVVPSQRIHSAATAPSYGSSLRTLSTPELLVSDSSCGDLAVVSLRPPVALSGLQNLTGCAPCVCIRLHGCMLHTLPLDVQRWLQQLQQQNRLHVIVGPSHPGASGVCLWLCVFSDASTYRVMVFPAQQSSTGLSFIAAL